MINYSKEKVIGSLNLIHTPWVGGGNRLCIISVNVPYFVYVLVYYYFLLVLFLHILLMTIIWAWLYSALFTLLILWVDVIFFKE